MNQYRGAIMGRTNGKTVLEEVVFMDGHTLLRHFLMGLRSRDACISTGQTPITGRKDEAEA